MKLIRDLQKSMRSTKSSRHRKNLNHNQKGEGNRTENAEKAAANGLLDHLLKAENAHLDHHHCNKVEAEDLHSGKTVADRTEIGVGEESGVDR